MRDRNHTELVYTAIGQLSRLTDLFQKRRIHLAEEVGLSEQQWLVLEEISSEHFIPSMFAKTRESSQAAVSKIIRQLLDKELITVSISESDGRQREYKLTKKGIGTMKRLRQLRNQAIEGIWMDIKPQQLVMFNRFSQQLIDSIEAFVDKKE